MMELRPYQSADAAETAALFYGAVHTVAARDYTKEQLNAWAPESRELTAWDESLLAHYALVAVQNGVIVGFGDMDEQNAYLDRLYTHRDHQGRGVATALLAALEARVQGRAITTHASLTAKPFFEKRGYMVKRRQRVTRGGVWLHNYVMVKPAPCAACRTPSPGR